MGESKVEHREGIVVRLPEDRHYKGLISFKSSQKEFKKYLEDLDGSDLFIQGDVCIRSDDPLGIIQTLIYHNSNNVNKIHALRGRHEDLFLKFYEAIQKKQLDDSDHDAIMNFLLHGGIWALQEGALKELIQFNWKKILKIKNDKEAREEFKDFYNEQVRGAINKRSNKQLFIDMNDLAKVQEYFSQLPFAIQYRGITHTHPDFTREQTQKRALQELPAQRDIVQIEQSTEGLIKYTGDVHGNAELLEKVLAKLGPKDTLIIAGDLMDRGVDSPGVIKAVMRRNKDYPGSVLVVRGDHEDNFIKFYEIAFSREALTEDDHKKIKTFLFNGGEWVFKDPNIRERLKEIKSESELNTYYEEIIEPIMKGSPVYIRNQLIDDLSQIHHFVKTLPYVIDVQANENKKGFVVAHATLKLTDEEVQSRINDNGLLNDEERYNTSWDREANNVRKSYSKRLIVGHTVVENGHSVNEGTNTISLDVSRYNGLLVVNHTTDTVDIVQNTDAKPDPNIKLAAQNIDLKLRRDRIQEKIDSCEYYLPRDLRGDIEDEATSAIHQYQRAMEVELSKCTTIAQMNLVEANVNATLRPLEKFEEVFKEIEEEDVDVEELESYEDFLATAKTYSNELCDNQSIFAKIGFRIIGILIKIASVAAGAAAGAALGSFLGPVGTIVFGILGGLSVVAGLTAYGFKDKAAKEIQLELQKSSTLLSHRLFQDPDFMKVREKQQDIKKELSQSLESKLDLDSDEELENDRRSSKESSDGEDEDLDFEDEDLDGVRSRNNSM